MTDQAQWWAGEAGNQYTRRNRVNWLKRVPFWTEIIARTGAGTVYEVGCNFGANLLALRAVNPNLHLAGVDVNELAVEQAQALGLDVMRFVGSAICDGCDLAFTAGVLIHVPPDDLETTMQSLINTSRKYVLAIEYEALDEQEIIYRGEHGRLWKRPYGRLYEGMGLREVDSGYLSDVDGFDKNGVTWWLMTK